VNDAVNAIKKIQKNADKLSKAGDELRRKYSK